MATIATSIEVVPGPIPEADDLDARVATLRRRFPRANIDRYLSRVPAIGEKVLLCAGATLVGDVRLGDDTSIWYGAVLRADLAPIIVGTRANIQDGTVVHVADDTPCVVGAETVIGHRVMLHACKVGEGCIIGMQSTILDDAEIGQGSIVGAGAVVTQRMVIPPRSLVLGAPAKVVKALGPKDEEFHRAVAMKYVRLKENYLRDALRHEQ